MAEDEEVLYDGPSRSQVKREYLSLQDLLHPLAEAPSLLPRLEAELSAELYDGIELLSRMKPSGARNRQIRHLTKLLSREEIAQQAIAELLDEEKQKAQAQTQRHHLLENWRDRLLEGDDSTLQECLESFPALERQPLRQLLRDHTSAKNEDRRRRLRRELFRQLRDADGHNQPN